MVIGASSSAMDLNPSAGCCFKPTAVAVQLLSSTSVLVNWQCSRSQLGNASFSTSSTDKHTNKHAQLLYVFVQILSGHAENYSFSHVVSCRQRETVITDLYTKTYYSFAMAFVAGGRQTLLTTEVDIFTEKPTVISPKIEQWNFASAVLFGIVVAAWLLTLYLFLQRWSNLRIVTLAPYTSSGVKPHNIDRVAVVTSSKSAVIYKEYGKRMSITMDQREQRLLKRLQSEGTIVTGKPRSLLNKMKPLLRRNKTCSEIKMLPSSFDRSASSSTPSKFSTQDSVSLQEEEEEDANTSTADAKRHARAGSLRASNLCTIITIPESTSNECDAFLGQEDEESIG